MTLFLAFPFRQLVQGSSSGDAKISQENRFVAIALVRTINTAEAAYRNDHGSYADWSTLLSNQKAYFESWLAKFGPKSVQRFTAAPEILPHWNLGLNIHPDGQGYDLVLRDTENKHCGYAVVTDENAIISQSKTIDCNI